MHVLSLYKLINVLPISLDRIILLVSNLTNKSHSKNDFFNIILSKYEKNYFININNTSLKPY